MRDIQTRFESFHAFNPHVYNRLVKAARSVKQAGYKTYSIKTLWCVLRFELAITFGEGAFKLPDELHSRYGRLIMSQEPDLAGFFKTRTLRSV